METEKELKQEQEQEPVQQQEANETNEENQVQEDNLDSTKKKIITQDEILLAALKLFAEKGYFNTSLTDISKQVGANTTSKIYQHFKNKQAIAAALYTNILDSLNCSIDDIRRRNAKPSEQLREIVGLLFSLTDEAPEIMHFLLILNVKEFLPDELPIHQTTPFLKLNKVLQAGIKENEIRSVDAQQAYTYFFGVIFHTITLILLGVLNKKAEAYQSNSWVTAWNAISKK